MHQPAGPKMNRFFFVCLLFFAACTPANNLTATPQIITVYASPATQPWLSEAYTCAQELQLVISNSNDPAQADITIRMGEPISLNLPVFQIGTDDLLVVVHRESPVQNMAVEQVRALFSKPDASAQIWVFASGEDIQQYFSREVMQTASLASSARIALSPQQMSDALNTDKNIVGILPRRWMAGTVRVIFTLADVPVLALTRSEPEGAIKELLSCLQKRPAQ